MELSFVIIAAVIVASALGAMFLKNLVHCALSLMMTFAALAALYLKLNAQFVAFAQVLVYVGAVAILIVFALLLTRVRDAAVAPAFSISWIAGGIVAALVFAAFACTLLNGFEGIPLSSSVPQANTQAIGDALMRDHIVALELVGIVLTVSLIGAVLIAMTEREGTR